MEAPRAGLVLLIGLTALAACTKSNRASDSTHADTAHPATASTGSPPAEMPAPFDHISGQALHDYIASLHPGTHGTHVRPRTCKHGAANCHDDSTTVFIGPVDDARHLGSKDATGRIITLPNGAADKGYIIALLKNTGTKEEPWLGLQAGDSAYWLIEPDSSGGTRSRFIQIHPCAKGSWYIGELTRPGSLDFRGCNHKDKDSVEADFGECVDHWVPADSGPGVPYEANRGRGLDPSGDLQSTWISCVAGCCTASAGQAGQAPPPPPPPCKGKNCPPPCTGKGCADTAAKKKTKAATKVPPK